MRGHAYPIVKRQSVSNVVCYLLPSPVQAGSAGCRADVSLFIRVM
jgi:hypothetical protein